MRLLLPKCSRSARLGAATKSGDPVLLSIEAYKLTMAAKIARQTNLFEVPRIIEFDEQNGLLTTEWIPDLVPIRNICLPSSNSNSVMRRVGRALAAIHALLSLPPHLRIGLPASIADAGNQAFLHGDFSGENVCFRMTDCSVVILDWSMTRLLGGTSTFGTSYFDIAWFINNLFTKPVHALLRGPKPCSSADNFLDGYLAQAGAGFDEQRFRRYHARFSTYRLRLRKRCDPPMKRLMLAPGALLWRQYTTDKQGT